MTAQTPVYGLKYIVEGEPLRDARLALEQNALTIEAALVAGGVAAAGASDLLAVSGRVSALESDTGWQQAATVAVAGSAWDITNLRVRKVGRQLYWNGFVARPTWLNAETVLTMPPGWRPDFEVEYVARRGGGGTATAGRDILTYNSAGQLRIFSTNSSGTLGTSFSVLPTPTFTA